MSEIVVGLHVTGAQSSAGVVVDGKVHAAAAEERFDRIKRSRAFPKQALDWCLARAGLADLAQARNVVVSWNPGVHMRQLNLSGFTSWRRYDPEWLYIVPNQLLGRLHSFDADSTSVRFGETKGPEFTFVHHHLAHAGWAFASPFESAAVAIIDEYGEAASITLGRIDGNKFTRLIEILFPHSLGVLYATFTDFLGFQPNGDEWKVMGAAARGNPDAFAKIIREMVEIDPPRIRLDQSVFEFGNARFAGYSGEALARRMGIERRGPKSPMTQDHYDLAAAIQAVYEEILVALLAWLHRETGLRNLVLSGGCAMNSLANGKIIGNTGFERLFVGPAPADNGASIGAALWHHGHRQSGLFRTDVSAYTGPSWSDDAIETALEKYGLDGKHVHDPAGTAAQKIAEGRIVGWFQGAQEFGERALGSRSILADPRSAAMKDRINAAVKYRESFRPFAPSVLAEAARDWFDLPDGETARYMEKVYPVKAECRSRVPAIVHDDGTGRLQTVERHDNPLYHELIARFAAISGVPMVLNTSFNRNGEPIVTTPEDAIRTFYTTGLTTLFLGRYVLEKGK